ncbi:MAG: hypothetical protein LC624_01920 [Halobacteriales archaeon]|nr:hypothetical protein [Halobacteriales archaeon]
MAAHYARYGPQDRYERPPPAGMCISVFALLEQRGKVLVGLAQDHPRWRKEWLPQLRAYDDDERNLPLTWLRLPSTYLREGEHPERGLARVLRGQLRVTSWTIQDAHIGSWTYPSTWYPGHKHWDLAFTYRVKARLPAKHGPWWKELAWCAPGDVRAKDFGWSDDYARELGIAH